MSKAISPISLSESPVNPVNDDNSSMCTSNSLALAMHALAAAPNATTAPAAIPTGPAAAIADVPSDVIEDTAELRFMFLRLLRCVAIPSTLPVEKSLITFCRLPNLCASCSIGVLFSSSSTFCTSSALSLVSLNACLAVSIDALSA